MKLYQCMLRVYTFVIIIVDVIFMHTFKGYYFYKPIEIIVLKGVICLLLKQMKKLVRILKN